MSAAGQFLGAGKTRAVYDLGNGRIIKYALSWDGILNNLQEKTIFETCPASLRKYLATVESVGPNWLVMRKYTIPFPPTQEYALRLQHMLDRFLREGILPIDMLKEGRPRTPNLRLDNDGGIIVIDYGRFIRHEQPPG